MIEFFTGGESSYFKLHECMRDDVWWIVTYCASKLGVCFAYFLFARICWRKFQKNRGKHNSRVAKGFLWLMLVFIFCGICGYLMPVARLWWPAYRLEAVFDIILMLLTLELIHSARFAEFLKTIFASEIRESGQNGT